MWGRAWPHDTRLIPAPQTRESPTPNIHSQSLVSYTYTWTNTLSPLRGVRCDTGFRIIGRAGIREVQIIRLFFKAKYLPKRIFYGDFTETTSQLIT